MPRPGLDPRPPAWQSSGRSAQTPVQSKGSLKIIALPTLLNFIFAVYDGISFVKMVSINIEKLSIFVARHMKEIAGAIKGAESRDRVQIFRQI